MTATKNILSWKLRQWTAPWLYASETIDAYVAQMDTGYFYVIARHKSTPDLWTLEIEGQNFDGSDRQLRMVAECHARAKA
jgi:hypothetical protein